MSQVGRNAVEVLMSALQAFNDNDMVRMRELVSEDVTYVVHGHATVSGTFSGVDAFCAELSRIQELTGGTMNATPEVLLSDGEAVMVYMRVKGQRPDGRSYASAQAYLYRFRDGRLVWGETIPSDQRAFEAFFAD